MKLAIILVITLITVENLFSQQLLTYYEKDTAERSYLMHLEETKSHDLISVSIDYPYNLNYERQFSSIRKFSSDCNLIIKKNIVKDSFSVLISRIYILNSGFIAIGALRSKFDSLQFYIYILSLDENLNTTHEKYIPILHGYEPWWFMGKATSDDKITCVVSVSNYPAPSSGKRYNLFLSTNYDFSNLKYNIYQTSNYTDYCWDMESSIDNTSYWCPGYRFLLVDSFMNLRDSIIQPFHPDLCAGNTMGLKKFDQNNFIYAVSSCKDTNRNVVVMKLDKDLKPSLPITFGTKGYDIANPGKCLDWTKRDHIYVGGTTAFINFIDPTTFFLASLDGNLNLKWVKFFGGDYFYRLLSICATTDGGCVMGGGVSYNSKMNESDVFLIKVDSIGIITENKEIPSTKSWSITLYPNPGNDYFLIEYLNLKNKCIFELLDQFGRRIITCNLENNGNELIPVSELLPGLYYYRLKSKNNIIGSGSWIKM